MAKRTIAAFLPLLAILLTTNPVAAKDLPLIEAAKRSDGAALRRLVQERVNVNQPAVDGTTALHWAASHGDVDAVALLLKAGANARATNRYGVFPLSLACVNGNVAVIERLLKAGAKVTDSLPGGETPLMTVARTGSPEAVKLLLAHGADPNAKEDTRGQTALMWASAQGNAAAMKVLIEGGATVRARSNERDFTNWAPLSGGGAIGEVQNGIHIEFSPLFFAVRNGKAEAVRVLLDSGADVNETLPDGTSALVVAAINAHWDVGAYLLERGANPNAMEQGWNALHQVARTRTFNLGNVPSPMARGRLSSLDFAKKLLDGGVNVNAQMTKEIRNDGYRFNMSRVGATAYLIAAKGADAPMMRLLAEHKADTLIPNQAGTTPLMAAAGVDLNFLGEDTGTHDDAFEAVKVALAFPHDIAAANKNGDTALHGAARRGAIPIVQLLIAEGAKLDVKTRRGLTPLTVALGYYKGKPLFLNEQRQLEAALVIHDAMLKQGLPIDEDPDALALMKANAATDHVSVGR